MPDTSAPLSSIVMVERSPSFPDPGTGASTLSVYRPLATWRSSLLAAMDLYAMTGSWDLNSNLRAKLPRVVV